MQNPLSANQVAHIKCRLREQKEVDLLVVGFVVVAAAVLLLRGGVGEEVDGGVYVCVVVWLVVLFECLTGCFVWLFGFFVEGGGRRGRS